MSVRVEKVKSHTVTKNAIMKNSVIIFKEIKNKSTV